ncbi:hypothetical protein [Skermania sp. ID1734]|nr:hypothetical protein [Skermania sp. ID1734]
MRDRIARFILARIGYRFKDIALPAVHPGSKKLRKPAVCAIGV